MSCPFKKMEFIPFKAEQTVQGLGLKEKDAQKDESKENLFRKNL